jgi:hypothetical protein
MHIPGLEDLSVDVFFDGTRTKEENNCVSLRSIACSLNRIADALKAPNDKLDIIANSISRGFRELKESVEDK